MPKISEVVKEVNSMSAEEKIKTYQKFKEEFDRLREEKKAYVKELEELPEAKKGRVVMRIAPYPSGDLHIGNTKTFLLNDIYVKKYEGKLLLVIDDTIGSAKKLLVKEAFDLIPEGLEWLEVEYKKPIIYKSDRLKIYYEYAEKVIKKNRAYVCECPQETLRENRKNGRACGCRVLPLEEQMKRWKKMLKKGTKEGSYTLRIKTDLHDPDPAFRDRVLFRISNRKHPRVENKYHLWPMLEFSWAVDDILLGVTHVIRGKELMIETRMQEELWKILGLEEKAPVMLHGGMIKIEGIEGKLSKSKAQAEVLSGEFKGWDDPRTWSLHSLKRRGIRPEAIREFIKEIGLNQNDITVPIDKLYHINKGMIDEEANRYYFVKNPKKIIIENMPRLGSVEILRHPEKNELREVKVGKELLIDEEDYEKFKGKEVRLMNLFNIKLKDNTKMLEDNTGKGLQKIQWVPKKF
ncbi:glutamate--tRNA ligase, partial [Candidatus Pacearchaeota archaeon CG10_big_fil_rev_8_21_14_0_10_35_13]